jgi:hypothetical protein
MMPLMPLPAQVPAQGDMGAWGCLLMIVFLSLLCYLGGEMMLMRAVHIICFRPGIERTWTPVTLPPWLRKERSSLSFPPLAHSQCLSFTVFSANR